MAEIINRIDMSVFVYDYGYLSSFLFRNAGRTSYL